MKEEKLNTSTLRPGVLVSLKTSIHGNVRYDKRNLFNDTTAEGASIVEWETRRTTFDPVEYKRASEVRMGARNLIARACIDTAFGLLCPPGERQEQLRKAVKEARAMVRAFNSTATMTVIRLYVVTGVIADNDVEAFKAINMEIADLISQMRAGFKAVDVKVIREAASRALKLGQMLPIGTQEWVKETVDMVRTGARQIVKAGEQAAQDVDLALIETLAAKRTAFLDMDDMAGDIGEVKGAGRAVDLASTREVEVEKPRRKRIAARSLELT